MIGPAKVAARPSAICIAGVDIPILNSTALMPAAKIVCIRNMDIVYFDRKPNTGDCLLLL